MTEPKPMDWDRVIDMLIWLGGMIVVCLLAG